jgi:hypothetical protein
MAGVAGLLSATLMTVPASAQTVVTGSGGTFSNPASTNLSDPTCSGLNATWCAANVRNDGRVGITTTYGRSGNGSLEFAGPSGSSYKADFQYLLASPFSLSTLTALSFDYLRDASSTNPSAQAPALRLLIGNGGTHQGYLIYEPAYNGGVVQGSWQTADITAASNLWLYSLVDGQAFEQFDITLGMWQSDAGVAAFKGPWNGNLEVLGFEVGVGPGWDGQFRGAVDNVSYRTSTMNGSEAFNFEVTSTTVPEPSGPLLIAAGLAALAMARSRRRA